MDSTKTGPANVVYTMNNDPDVGRNAVLAYSRNPDGSLTDLSGSPFYTLGTGIRNPTERIGPDDTDHELIISPDKRFLFGVNQGSDNISVFRVRADGTLRLVDGSPFPSGGKQPSSLALSGGFLYVANRGDGLLPTAIESTYTPGTPGGTNYSVHQFLGEGGLRWLPSHTINAPDGSSPSEVVVTPDGQFMFGNNYLTPSFDTPFAPIFPSAHSLLLSCILGEDGSSIKAHSAMPLPRNPLLVINNVFRPFILGLITHPSQNILYVGVVGAGILTVWTWDDAGGLTFVRAVDPGTIGAAAGLCWLTIDPAAKWLYSANVGPNSISYFSLADPLSPVLVQNFDLGGPKALLPAGTPEAYGFTTAPFNLAVDPSGKYLYVVNHSTCVNTSVDSLNCPLGNAIHFLEIAGDGTLTEAPGSPMVFPPSQVPNNTRPKGLVVI